MLKLIYYSIVIMYTIIRAHYADIDMDNFMYVFQVPVNLVISSNYTRSSNEIGASEFVRNMNIGWNLGDSLGSNAKECGYDLNVALETKWGNPVVTKELIDYVAEQGFNTIRIPVSWCYNCGRDDEGHLQIGEQWMDRVHEVVDYAMEDNLYVIINTMCDAGQIFYCGVESEEEWQTVKQDALDLWTQIAESFKEYDYNLLFESYNELDNKVQGWTYSDLAASQMNELNQIFVDAVRGTGENNDCRILIVPTLFDSTKTNMLNAFILPDDISEDRMIANVHCYEEEWDQDIEWIFQSLEDFSNRISAPVIIDEFGARDDYCIPELRMEFTSNYVARAAEHGIKCCVWDDGYHWKIIDRYDYSLSNQELIDSLFEGVDGKKYETPQSDKIIFDSMDDFYFGGMDLATGVVSMVDYENKYWASLTTKSSENDLLSIEKEGKITVSMIAKNNAVNFWIYGITFFDSDKNPISYKIGKNISHKFICADIPETAVYYAVNTYDPYNNHKQEQIQEYFADGDLKMIITFVD